MHTVSIIVEFIALGVTWSCDLNRDTHRLIVHTSYSARILENITRTLICRN